jgi:hypothetical protein
MQELFWVIDRLDGQLTEINARARRRECHNEFARKYACKHFSQSDEDGITLEIIKRVINPRQKTFIEIGVGNGQENNTLVLLSIGWRGVWLGGEDLCFDIVEPGKRLTFIKSWISNENIINLASRALVQANIDIHNLGLLSIDLDGNDYYLLKSLLEAGCLPEVIVCEYNAIFPPSAEWCQAYNPNHQWASDHLFGASLLSFVKLLEEYNYFPVACNPGTGCNVFFAKISYRSAFPDVPTSIEDIYIPPYYRVNNKFHHSLSPQFLKTLI